MLKNGNLALVTKVRNKFVWSYPSINDVNISNLSNSISVTAVFMSEEHCLFKASDTLTIFSLWYFYIKIKKFFICDYDGQIKLHIFKPHGFVKCLFILLFKSNDQNTTSVL